MGCEQVFVQEERGKRGEGTRVKDRVMETMKGGERGLGRGHKFMERIFFSPMCPLRDTPPYREIWRGEKTHTHTQRKTKKR